MNRAVQLGVVFLLFLFFLFPIVSAFVNHSEQISISNKFDHFSLMNNPEKSTQSYQFSAVSPQTYHAISKTFKQQISRLWIALTAAMFLLPIVLPSHVCIFKWHHHFHFFDFYVNRPELAPPATI